MISNCSKCWIWFTLALGYNNPKVKGIMSSYSDIIEFFKGGKAEWKRSGLFTGSELERLSSVDNNEVKRIVARCNELGYSALCIDDEKYPECLRHIYAPPAVIYIKGEFPDVDNRMTVGIVGTRSASRYGVSNSYKFGYSLSKYGITVISGGALGVDCASHRGALAAGGVTICVRGCGINYRYLPENEQMRDAIALNGAVISEYPPDEAPRKYYFPARNRLIAALSDGVMIIESGKKSGSLITADLALEMGKPVFALVGNNDPRNEGSNLRIKEGSAQPVTDFLDIINYFPNVFATADVDFDDISLADIEAVPVKGKLPKEHTGKRLVRVESDKPEKKVKNEDKLQAPLETKTETKTEINLEGDELLVFEQLSDSPVHIDELASAAGIPVHRALSALTMLEIKGLVKAKQGRRFIRI